MATTTLQEIFHHVPITKVISQIRKPTHKLADFYGLMPGGANVMQIGGRVAAWDIFDSTRKISSLRAPDSPAATKKPQVVGHKQATIVRSFEQVPVTAERLFRNRGIGQPLGSVDTMGQRWVAKQIEHQVERFGNMRELMTALMFKGGFEITIAGDEVELAPTGSGGAITVDFGHPASNQGAVPKLGGGNVFAGNWNNTTAPIIDELLALNAHAANASRYPIEVAWVDAETAGYILQNEQVKALGGTANMVASDGSPVTFTGERNPEGKLSNHMSFVLRGYPSIRWMIYDDHVLASDGTRLPFIDNGKVLFTPGANDGWVEGHEGSEPVKRDYNTEITEEFGMSMWVTEQMNPTGFSMFGVDNFLPVPLVPSAWYWATVHSA